LIATSLRTRCCIGVTVLATLAGEVSAQSPAAPAPAIAPQAQSIRVTADNVRLNNYLNDLAGPHAFIRVVGGGLISHLRDEPGVRNDGTDDLVRRIASKAGQAAVQVSVRHGLAALMGRSTDYQPCECRGFGPLVEHALRETFTDRRADGSRAFSVPRVAGAYAAGFSQLAWERDRSVGDVALSTTLNFGLTAVFNVARELIGSVR
jgi:hypothetical protein